MTVPSSAEIKRNARALGFDHVGICPAIQPAGYHAFLEWLDLGYAGEMHYLSRRSDAYRHPTGVMSGVRSLVMLGMNYHSAATPKVSAAQGRVSKYAWGQIDYHSLIHDRLRRLLASIQQNSLTLKGRGVVDTAPLLEREFARLAGLGWVGKHTLLLNRHAGSYFFLAALLLDAELDYDPPDSTDYCGTCTACLDACPTQAFPRPYVLDATRCISYLTIEQRSAIDPSLRAMMDDWVFGCDVCQDVCPWNRGAPKTAESTFAPRDDLYPIALSPLFQWTDAEFRARFKQTPLWRAKRRGLLRNAAIVLGNHPCEAAIPALARGLEDEEALVRDAAAWALGRHHKWPAAIAALHRHRGAEG